MIGSFTRVRLIAGTTFLEAVRQRIFASILLVAIGLVGSATFFQQFGFGTGELRFIADFGFGATIFFGSILSIAATTQLFFNEIENRTALTMLAKPVHRFEFILGKFFGAWLLMGVFVLVVSMVLHAVLWWRATELMALPDNNGVDSELSIRYFDLYLFAALQMAKFAIMTAITLFIGSFANTNLFTIMASFFALIICQLQYIARDAYVTLEGGLSSTIATVASYLVPNFQLFNLGDQLMFGDGPAFEPLTLLRMFLYAFLYTLAILGLAHLFFRQREV